MFEFLPDMICTEQGMIAKTVLLPGDPLRAKYIAENFLEKPVLYNTARGLYGYTGWYKNSRVSVQSTGMGTTCIMECAYQLIEKYGCRNLIRIGTSGSDNPDIHVGDTICSMASSSLSNNTAEEFGSYDYIPTSDFKLIKMASEAAKENNIRLFTGPTKCGDVLYPESDCVPDFLLNPLKGYRFAGGEMEGAGLLVAASHYEDVKALVMVTCSDHQLYAEEDTPLTLRESAYTNMMKISLEVAHKLDKEEH